MEYFNKESFDNEKSTNEFSKNIINVSIPNDDKLQKLNFEFLKNEQKNNDDADNDNLNIIKKPPSPLPYNDYVNQTYLNKNNNNSSSNNNYNNNSNKLSTSSISDESKPLLVRYPIKSIVKSPSSQSFLNQTTPIQQTSNNVDGGELNNRHVQFLSSTSTLQDDTKDTILQMNDAINSPTASLCSNNLSRLNSSRSNSSSSRNSNSSSSSSSDDENSSIGQFSEARPPDGGWGWVVVFASFMINLIADGVTFSFGIFFVEFQKTFGEGKAKTAWIGSLFMAMPLLSGPIASFLTDRYGCRKVTIAGSILACIGFVTSAFCNTMEMLFLTFGILAGFGLSLCYVAAVVIVAYYFDKKRSFATGLSVCGSGIGTFIFPPFIYYLLATYAWRGTVLIVAGIFLNITIFGLLMRDLEWTTHSHRLKSKKRNKIKKSADSFSVSNSTNTGGTSNNNGTTNENNEDDDVFESHIHHVDKKFDLDDPRIFSSLINLPTYIKRDEKVPSEVLELLQRHRNVRDIVLQNYPGLLHSRSFSEPFTNIGEPIFIDSPPAQIKQLNKIPMSNYGTDINDVKTEDEFLTWLQLNNNLSINKHQGHNHHHTHNISSNSQSNYLKDLRMHRHSLTYRGAMLNINRYRLRASSCPDIYRNSMTTIAKEKIHWYQGIAEFKNLFVDILDFSYFTDIRFLLFTLSNFLLYTWYDVPYMYLVDYANEIGHSEADSSVLISIIGIVNMVGEIFLGWFGDKKWLSVNCLYAISMACCGAVMTLVPMFKSYEALSVISGSFGLFIAANYSLTSIILVELITLEKFTNAYGLLLLVQGIANLVGPPLAGWVYDVTGSYDLSFYLAGFFIILSGVILLILPAIGKYKKYKALKRQDSGNLGTISKNNQRTSINIENKFRSESPNSKMNGTILTDCFGKDLIKDSIKINHV